MENRSPDDGVPVTQVRIARPTDRLVEVVRFYRDALGLKQIASFEDHATSGSPCPAPTKDNLLGYFAQRG